MATKRRIAIGYPHMIIDSFIKSFGILLEYSRICSYSDIENPVDGVVYPDICTDIPDICKSDIIGNITEIIGREPKKGTMFIRMSKAGVKVPHSFHNDVSMGAFSMMLYLHDNDSAGTGFALHKPTGNTTSEGVSCRDIIGISGDSSDLGKWDIYSRVKMKANRALLFDSQLFHVAMPIGGYGNNQNTARVVLTYFFS